MGIRKPKALVLVTIVAVVLVTLIISACAGAATPEPAKPAAQKEAPKPTEAPKPAEAAKPTEAPKPAAPTTVPTTAPATTAAKVVIVIGNDPSTLDPQFADDGNERAVNDNIYETLLARDAKTAAIVPSLAESYQQVNPTTWRFKLRQGVKFHNGEDFNAEAVAFSVKRIIDPNFKSEQLSFVGTMVDAKVVDASTVDIITNGPDPILPARVTWMKIVPPKYAGEKDFVNKPVGTGPYKFVEWQKGRQVVLTRNDAYWGGAPPIKDVVIRPIEEEGTRLAALQAGEADLVRGLIPEYVGKVPKSAHIPGLEFPWIRINTNKGKLADVRVRQALNYAIDKEALAKSLYSGYAVVADGQLLTKGHFGYNPEVKAYPFDQAKAKALLKEASAEKLTLELIGESGRWLKDRELVEAIAGQLSAVGVEVKPKIVEWKAWLDLLFAGADKAPDLQYSSHDNVLLDADRTLSALFQTKGSQSAWSNAEFDKLVEDARTETDVKKREGMYHKAVQIAHDQAAAIFLLNLEDIYGLSKRLEWTPRLDGRILVKEMKVTQ